jgi:hypothetical protein
MWIPRREGPHTWPPPRQCCVDRAHRQTRHAGQRWLEVQHGRDVAAHSLNHGLQRSRSGSYRVGSCLNNGPELCDDLHCLCPRRCTTIGREGHPRCTNAQIAELARQTVALRHGDRAPDRSVGAVKCYVAVMSWRNYTAIVDARCCSRSEGCHRWVGGCLGSGGISGVDRSIVSTSGKAGRAAQLYYRYIEMYMEGCSGQPSDRSDRG